MKLRATTTKSFDGAEKFANKKLELFKLKLVGHSAKVLTNLTSKLTTIVVVAFFCFFLSVGFCLYLGYFFQMHIAFFIVASIFLLFGLLLIFSKGKIIEGPMHYLIITSLLKEMEKPIKKNHKEENEVIFDN